MLNEFAEEYDVVVIGGGHAGCEAAWAASKMGVETALFTMNVDLIAQMSCNPSIGGTAKGHLVREIDALGGVMGAIADRTGIQFRLLNSSRGPAVQSPRAQCDKALYRSEMKRLLETQPNLHLKQNEIVDLVVEEGRVVGLEVIDGRKIRAQAVILTTGTFLNGLIHVGEKQYAAGRAGELPSIPLAERIRGLGFSVGRLKTGTPPRLDQRTIDFEKFTAQTGDDEPTFFSFKTKGVSLPQVECFLAYSNQAMHQIVKQNLERSPLYGGMIKGIGPRYCPSFEDKIVKFPDKDRHQIILEPEGLSTNEIYVNGMSTSMPIDVQSALLRSLPGLEKAKMIRPGYAIEYDFVQPTDLHPWLETQQLRNLFHAGQINGTTGYEEAAAQGLMAGINAALKVRRKDPFIPDRSDGYIGVLMDDLIRKGVDEPYRMFTSRAEYRLLLRIDNADQRLTPLGYRLGLVNQADYQSCVAKYVLVDEIMSFLKTNRLKDSVEEFGILLTKLGMEAKGARLYDLLKRPEIVISDMESFVRGQMANVGHDILKIVQINVKFEGYINQQQEEIHSIKKINEKAIPDDIDYMKIPGLSIEVRQKLSKARPRTVGLAGRIPGITPAALSVINIYIEIQRRLADKPA